MAASWAVTQKADPSFYTQYGSEWLPIAVVTVTDRTLKVTLSAGTNGEAAADAVRIDPVSATKIVDNGDAGYSTVGTVGRVSPTHVQGVLDDYDWIASSDAGSSASWTVSGLKVNQPYLVSASWVPSSANSQAARYRIFDAGTRRRVGHGDGEPGSASQQFQRGPFELAEPGRVHTHQRFAAGDGGFALGQQLAGDRGRDPGERIGEGRIVGPELRNPELRHDAAGRERGAQCHADQPRPRHAATGHAGAGGRLGE